MDNVPKVWPLGSTAARKLFFHIIDYRGLFIDLRIEQRPRESQRAKSSPEGCDPWG